MSDIEKMTQKSQEAMQAAARLAEERHHSAVEPEHLAFAILRQEDGIVPRVLARMNVNSQTLAQDLERRMTNLPTITGGGVRVVASPALQRV